ncbi:long-chain-fatty-acid--CoA ligase [Qipengyuania atrilutea]|uniref:Long-chain fatty acid--CoA ligase n=1 Tax=Qipengyuania atrilutea TaxID=2744473 RepID=A0A850H2J8_9SPHN|nr:long-chain fatty acid--CoA ligase [Actirhodobacter atriluteus]NVD44422.1 long-chain fatty acid--CoA ligase [Actirhodobacter atriluteus]
MAVNNDPVAFPATPQAAKASYHHPCQWDAPLDPATLPAFFAEGARLHPDRTLVEFLGAQHSYSALFDEACRFAAGLIARGVAKGDRVGLFLPNVPMYISAYYGAMMADAVVVNFSPLYTVAELTHQVEDSGTKLLVTLDAASLLPTALEVLDTSALDTLIVGRLADMLPWYKGAALRTLGRSQIEGIPDRTDVQLWDDALTSRNYATELGDDWSDPLRLDPDDLALLQYTGGTTGTPKGAMLTHANLSSNAQQVDAIDPFDPHEDDIVLGALPLFHVFANTCVLNRTVLRGGTIIMLPRFVPKQVLAAIRRTKPTAFPGVPTMYQALLDHPDCAKTDFSAMKICISGGAPMPGPLRDKFEARAGVRLVEGYGLTESSGVVSVNPYRGLRKPGTIGQLLPQTRVILLDKEDPTKIVGVDEPGELAVAGPQIMKGYWNRPDAAKNSFAEHLGETWLRTGDVATVDTDGFIAIVDRLKDMIAVGGFKVFPSQVEHVIQDHPAVKEVLVIGAPDDYRGECVHAYVVLNEDFDTDESALCSWANERLGKHERLDKLVIREELPKTMIGKLDRKALRAEVQG